MTFVKRPSTPEDAAIWRQLNTVHDELARVTDDSKVYTFSPILHRYIGMQSGVKMYGTFTTDDDSVNGIMSYATFWRSENNAVPHDGVGLAWRKGDKSKYNVYVIDNNPLTEEIFITNQVLREDVGINNYIGAAKYLITKDTVYWFSVKLLTDNSIVAKIWSGAKDDEPIDTAEPAQNDEYIIIYVGARALPFREGSEPDYQMGVGIEGTEGNTWKYDNIEVIALESGYPYGIFQFKVNPAEFTGAFDLKYYGYGIDQNSEYGAYLYLLNDAESWVLIGSGNETEASDPTDTLIRFSDNDINDYLQPDGYLYAAARPIGSYGEKNLYTHYISLENILASGIHMGNTIDLWMDAPEKITETTVDIASVSGTITIDSVNFATPIQEIVDITDSGLTILADDDWYMSTEAGSAFSVNPNQFITLKNAYQGVNETFTIRYRYYADGASMQTTIDSSDYRPPGSSNYIKIMAPTVLEVNTLSFRGNLTEEQVVEYIKDFVYAIDDGVFEITDLISYLYDQGVTYIDLSTLNITVRSYSYKNIKKSDFGDAVESRYTIDGFSSFYTSTEDIGVTKLV